MRRLFIVALLLSLLAYVVPALAAPEWVMVMNNTFRCCGNPTPSVILVDRADGALVNRDWIVPTMGEGNWDGNCSAEDVVQVGSTIWIGGTNANCPEEAAIYVYDVNFAGATPAATFAGAHYFTLEGIGLAGLQPRQMTYHIPTNKVFLGFDQFPGGPPSVISIDASTVKWTGEIIDNVNAWGTLDFDGKLVYGTIGSGASIRTADYDLNPLGILVGDPGFWPYELAIAPSGNLLASGFTGSTPYGIREWDKNGGFVKDVLPGARDLRGMAVLNNGNYLISSNREPKSLIIWDGVKETDVITATGSGVQSSLSPYGMGTLKKPGAGCTGKEKVNKKALCQGGTYIAKLKGGAANDTFEVRLSSGQSKEGTLNNKGKGKAKFKKLSQGPKGVTVTWGCGATEQYVIDCF